MQANKTARDGNIHIHIMSISGYSCMGVMGAKQQLHAYTNSQINIESMSKIHTYKLHMIT